MKKKKLFSIEAIKEFFYKENDYLIDDIPAFPIDQSFRGQELSVHRWGIVKEKLQEYEEDSWAKTYWSNIESSLRKSKEGSMYAYPIFENRSGGML